MDPSMTTLTELLLSAENRPQVISDAVALVDTEVKAKGGVSGMAIKAGYGAVNKIAPTLVRDAVDKLIDRFVERLEPFYADWEGQGKPGSFESHIVGRPKEVANALLAVTDERARQVDAGMVKKTYEKLRPMGEKNVVAALPGLGRTIGKYV